MRPVWRPSSIISSSACASSLAELALVHRGDQVGEPSAPLLVVHEREHGLRLAERDLGRVAGA